MSIEKIREKVLEAARTEAAAIVGKAEEAARIRLERARASAEDRFRKGEGNARAELTEQHGREVAAAKAANKLRLLTLKSEILSHFFDAAVDRFVGRRDGDYLRWLSDRLASVAAETGTIVPAQEDRVLIEKMLEDLRKQGLAGGLSLSDQSLPLRGGFVLRGEKIDVDLSLDTRLSDLRRSLLPELAKMAFGDAHSGAQASGTT